MKISCFNKFFPPLRNYPFNLTLQKVGDQSHEMTSQTSSEGLLFAKVGFEQWPVSSMWRHSAKMSHDDKAVDI